MKKSFLRKYLCLLLGCLLAASLTLSGCSAVSASGNAAADTAIDAAADTDAHRFEAFTRQFFTDIVSTDALTLHYKLKDPSAYGISLDTVDLGSIDLSAADAENPNEDLEALMAQLHSFDYDKLDADQQLTWDILDEYLQTELSIDSQALYYYPEPLTNSSGTHSMLPITMAEYAFYDTDDIEDYLTLLADFPDYLNSLLEYEQAKSEAGLFMSDEAADEVIAACEDFIAVPEENLLIEVFPEKLDTLTDLSETDREHYIRRNETAVQDAVIPAYQALIEGLQALKGSGTNEYGLYYYEYGTDYYEYLIKTQTGSGKTPEALIEWVEDTMDADMVKLAFLLSADQDLYSRLNQDVSLSISDPVDMLDALQEAMTEDFPEPVTDQYTLKDVPDSLADSMNPAFFMLPPVDDPYDNVIYLNNSKLSDNLTVFTTLAHEGFPGHLYQYAAFAATEPDPIRQVLTFLGYSEGWASYVENMSYEWAGLDDGVCRCLQINQEVTLCLYARIDLGIHYEGWTEADTAAFLTNYGITDADIVHEIFLIIVSDPASYLPYCIGLLEFQSLRDSLSESMGDAFNLKDFHESLLNIGPCQFDIIDKYLQNDKIIS